MSADLNHSLAVTTGSSSSGSRSPASPPASDFPSSSHPSPAAGPDRSHRHSLDPQRTQLPASRGGCWTCRVRRKKCDEEHIGDSCKTCIRLKIDCLGWGPRPLWLRDKQALEAYKAGIKAKLKEAGLIRGVPRTPPAPAPSTPVSSVPSVSTTPHLPLPAATGSCPSYTREDTSYFPDQQSQYAGPSINIPVGSNTTMTYQAGSVTGYSPSLVDYSPISPGSAVTQTRTERYTPSSQHPQSSTSSFVEQAPAGRGLAAFMPPTGSSAPSPVNTNPPSSIEQQHVLYYFQSVLPIQYIFAADSLTNVLHDLIIQDPLGAVTTASCALASLHNKLLRVARGLELPDAQPEQSTANAFYARAVWQLDVHKVLNERYSEADAISALHLIWFWVFQGGSGEWPVALDIACEWLDQSTGISRGENPKMLILKLSEAGKFSIKTTMWMDIFSSITFQQAPRFLSLYRRLLGGGGAGYWARGDLDLRMNALMGCPDDVLLAFAEISALAQWKAQERQQGTLSMRELIKRGDLIEELLRRPDSTPPTGREYEQQQQHPAMATQQGSNVPITPGSELQIQVARIFRETAILYLHTILSETNPGVPEIANAVTNVLANLRNLRPTIADRALIFPMFLTGCMTDVPAQRDAVKRRMTAQDETYGNIRSARLVMESVWRVRDTQGGAVDWKNIMRDSGLNLLLV